MLRPHAEVPGRRPLPGGQRQPAGLAYGNIIRLKTRGRRPVQDERAVHRIWKKKKKSYSIYI